MVKYIAHFDLIDKPKKRNYFPSCVNKVSYILKALSELNYNTEIISASNSIVNEKLKAESVKIFNNSQLTLLKGYKRGSKVRNFISTAMFNLNFFFRLLFSLRRSDIVIVYHSLSLCRMVKFLKKIKNFKLVLEVEEIYSDVSNNVKERNRELKYFKIADAYIFPTQLLCEMINIYKKPFVIIHGTYNVEQKYNLKFDDNRVHCVYAGTFDPRKGGVVAAATAALFLNEKYHMHIIGFGSKNDEDLLMNLINDISQKTPCKITYDGLKLGEEYIKFIQKCDIGLSTQNPNAKFNDSSFPSKILSYMANGLRVVSVRIPVIEFSAIDHYMFYYSEQTPKKIADTIIKINVSDEYDSRKIIAELGEDFKFKLGELLNRL